MQSSFNVIKNNSVKNTGLREIVTSAESTVLRDENEFNQKNIESYESLARSIVENARKQSEQILVKAYEDAGQIEENAKRIEADALIKAEQLKNDAYQFGYEEGYSTAFKQVMDQVKTEREAIIASAVELLNNAKFQYEEYLQGKAQEINDLIITIAKTVLKKEVEDKSSINDMVFEAVEMSKKAKNFIIRCNSVHAEELSQQIIIWKEHLGFFGEIFIIADNSIEIGNAVIDKGNGKIVVGVDYALQRIKQILEGKD